MIREQTRHNSKGNVNYHAVQMAKIKSTDDEAHSGKMKVWLMSSNTDEDNPDNWISVRYASPFAGISNPADVSQSSIQSYGGTQKSYGIFAVPPDPDNVVLISFANGEPDEGFWFAGTFVNTMTQMVPGIPKTQTYDGFKPASEVNRFSQQYQSPKAKPTVPSHTPMNNIEDVQEVTDEFLGVGHSGVWRDETPRTMGWLSPSGHQFIMDDKDGYQLIRLRTPSGVQLLLCETTGDVFMINKSGDCWIRLENEGNISMYSKKTINMYAGEDINMTAEQKINITSNDEYNLKSKTTKIEGSESVSLKAPPWQVKSSQIRADVHSALSAGQAPPGGFSPIGDNGDAAGDVTKTPVRGGITVLR